MKIFTTVFFVLLLSYAFSQNQGNVWYFGGDYNNQSQPGAGLDFNSGSPVALTNSGMGYTEGCASYCNSAGQILFYAKGEKVFDRSHNIMLNGDSLGGNWSSQQGVIIVPVTNDTNRYFIFNNDGSPTGNGTGLYYAEIDMTLNGGLGGVLNPKAVPLISSTSEQLTGCKHANGIDFWVITNLYSSSIFYAYRVSPSGVSAPVITDLGFNSPTIGCIEINPVKNMLALKVYAASISGRYLVDFDNSTGVFSNPYLVTDYDSYNTACGFSPDGNLFYDVKKTNGSGTDTLLQFDLNASNIYASRVAVAALPGGFRIDMKTAPDGKIYITNDFYNNYLEAINFPNLPGPACNWQNNAAYLGNRFSGVMLPNELLIAENTNSINNFISSSGTTVYPNPFTKNFSVNMYEQNLKDVEFIFRNVLGEIIFREKEKATGLTFTKEFDNLNFSQGTYFLEIISGNEIRYVKMIKE